MRKKKERVYFLHSHGFLHKILCWRQNDIFGNKIPENLSERCTYHVVISLMFLEDLEKFGWLLKQQLWIPGLKSPMSLLFRFVMLPVPRLMVLAVLKLGRYPLILTVITNPELAVIFSVNGGVNTFWKPHLCWEHFGEVFSEWHYLWSSQVLEER